MDIEKIKNTPREFRRTIQLGVRTTPDIKEWLKEKGYSATKIFNEAIKDLGYKPKRVKLRE